MDIWGVIAEERTSLLDTFEGLTGEQWEVPSLCGSWTVRQVLAHLTLAMDPPMGRYGAAVAKALGSFDKANDRLAREEAERPIDELLARYRERIPKRFAVPGLGPAAPLSDILLHSLDVRIPLGISTAPPPERYEATMELLLTRRAQQGFVPKRRPSLRWVATDHPWSGGAGPEVEGTMADLALAASGRAARLDALGGPGQRALSLWLL